MLVHVLREYNVNKIFLSRLGLWPFQSKLVRDLLPTFYLVLEISFYPFEVISQDIRPYMVLAYQYNCSIICMPVHD